MLTVILWSIAIVLQPPKPYKHSQFCSDLVIIHCIFKPRSKKPVYAIADISRYIKCPSQSSPSMRPRRNVWQTVYEGNVDDCLTLHRFHTKTCESEVRVGLVLPKWRLPGRPSVTFAMLAHQKLVPHPPDTIMQKYPPFWFEVTNVPEGA